MNLVIYSLKFGLGFTFLSLHLSAGWSSTLLVILSQTDGWGDASSRAAPVPSHRGILVQNADQGRCIAEYSTLLWWPHCCCNNPSPTNIVLTNQCPKILITCNSKRLSAKASLFLYKTIKKMFRFYKNIIYFIGINKILQYFSPCSFDNRSPGAPNSCESQSLKLFVFESIYSCPFVTRLPLNIKHCTICSFPL